jgi:hypothetical protein
MARSEMGLQSASRIRPFSSVRSRSSLDPYPFSTAQEAPLTRMSLRTLRLSLVTPPLPTPAGTSLKISARSSLRLDERNFTRWRTSA